MKKPKKSHLQYATLKAAEFFRDELHLGGLMPHQRKKIEALNKLCWHVLGEISLKDAMLIEVVKDEMPSPNP